MRLLNRIATVLLAGGMALTLGLSVSCTHTVRHAERKSADPPSAAVAAAPAAAPAATGQGLRPTMIDGTRIGRMLPEDKLKWYRDAKFGLFIHWGLYAVPAGEYKDRRIGGIGEWIQKRGAIPLPEYEAFAKEFNPVKFDAEAWAQLAQDAGMKYLTITSKHHDGFAMFDSNHPYNIVDATPFKRDVIKELAAACQKRGIKLCFYYSQAQDWNDPNGIGNNLDFPDDSKKNFDTYMNAKALPQMRELLTQYGPIGLIWYDTPATTAPEHSWAFYNIVRELQPDTLVCSRVGNGLGDYMATGDNQIPKRIIEMPWETPATINDTWGFKKYDHNWKSTEELLHNLVDIVSKGGNYLLNVGPTAEGVIPEPSVERLREMGAWLKRNGESIYGSKPTEFPIPEWGRITMKPGKLYLHVMEWPADGRVVLRGLGNDVSAAYLLSDETKKSLRATKQQDTLTIQGPTQAPDAIDTVIAVEFNGDLKINRHPVEQTPDGVFTLTDREAQYRDEEIAGGKVRDWYEWDAVVNKPGWHEVSITYSLRRGEGEIIFHAGDLGLTGRVLGTGRYDRFVTEKLGAVNLKNSGPIKFTLKPYAADTLPNVDFQHIELKPVAEVPAGQWTIHTP